MSGIPILQFSKTHQQSMLDNSRNINVRPGDYLFREGQVCDKIFLVTSGQIDLEMTVPGRGPVRILSLSNGELVGWSGILGDGVMTSSARCIASAELVEFQCAAIQKLIEADNDFGSQFMRMMAESLARRLLATRLQLLDLFSVR